MCNQLTISSNLKLLLLVMSYFTSYRSEAQIYTLSEFSQNSTEADFSAVFVGDDIVFCSSRSRKTTNFNQDSVEVFYTDLFRSSHNGGGNYTEPLPLKGNVNSFFNEGHATFSKDGLTMIYTANLVGKSGRTKNKTDEYKLGLFMAKFVNGEWLKTEDFQFNSQNSKFSNAHPCFAEDDNVLYFASNRPGGFGGSDIYRCTKTADGWSEPENLGENVNDEGNEFFPFVNKYGVLYFTSDGRYDSEGMDIYCCYNNDFNLFEDAFRLNNTINSAYDELAYCEKDNSNIGLLSSNRNSDQDDIFLFTKTDEINRQCLESTESIACYRFVDINLPKLEKNLPIVYKWELGDGTDLMGETIEHCYEKPGTYNIVLNAIDTLTKMTFSRISEAQVIVSDPNEPVLYIPDTVYAGLRFEASVQFEKFEAFEIKEIIWKLNDEKVHQGQAFEYTIPNEGAFQLKCELFSNKKNNGIKERVCLYKNVYVTQPMGDVQEPIVQLPEQLPLEVKMKSKTFGSYNMSELAITDNFYMLIIAESVEPISFEDSLFSEIHGQISEIKTDKGYIYAIERANNWKDLINLHTELKSKGILTSYTETFDSTSYEKSLIRKRFNTDIPLDVSSAAPDSIKDASTEVNSIQKIEALIAIQPNDRVAENKNAQVTALNADSVSTTNSKAVVFDTDSTTIAIPSKADIALTPVDPIIQIETPVTNHLKKDNAHYEIKPTSIEISSKGKRTSSLYHIVIDSVNNRIPFNGTYFENVHTEIAELKSGENFKYTILTASDPKYLQSPLAELKASGYDNARIVSYDLQSFSDSLVKIGRYIQPQNTALLNKEFAHLNDIKFDYNSCEILNTSYSTLNYIAAILALEQGFKLKVNAHTCNIGGSEFNKKLSQKRANNVIEYFVSKGIDRERLIAMGYGDSKPSVSNFTLDGRSTNRRVEFIIVFEGNKH